MKQDKKKTRRFPVEIKNHFLWKFACWAFFFYYLISSAGVFGGLLSRGLYSLYEIVFVTLILIVSLCPLSLFYLLLRRGFVQVKGVKLSYINRRGAVVFSTGPSESLVYAKFIRFRARYSDRLHGEIELKNHNTTLSKLRFKETDFRVLLKKLEKEGFTVHTDFEETPLMQYLLFFAIALGLLALLMEVAPHLNMLLLNLTKFIFS